MSHPRLKGKNALIMGNAYDLKKTLDMLHRLVCAFMDASGEKSATVSTRYAGAPAVAFPNPGVDVAEKVWAMIAQMYDVVDEPLMYVVGEVTFVAHLLGRTWSLYRPETGEIVTRYGEPATALNNTPIICVYGERSSGGAYALLSSAKIEEVGKVLEPLGLVIGTVSCHAKGGSSVDQMRYFATIALPYEQYGAGRKELVVRCILDGGGEITHAVMHKAN